MTRKLPDDASAARYGYTPDESGHVDLTRYPSGADSLLTTDGELPAEEPLAVLRMTPKLRKVILAGLERAYYHPGGSGPSREDYRWAQQIVAEAHPAEEE